MRVDWRNVTSLYKFIIGVDKDDNNVNSLATLCQRSDQVKKADAKVDMVTRR